ncbi:hypothetical protein FB446DRAFT_708143 [Lentinula raphanica]|nr:hypothetical protein FB446DRAFT_708143 [Lentinula raphanica]
MLTVVSAAVSAQAIYFTKERTHGSTSRSSAGTQLFATERSKDMRALEEKIALLAWVHKYCLEHPYLSEEEVTRREREEEEQRAKDEAASPMISLNGAFQGFDGGRLPMPQESSSRPIPDVSHLPTLQEPTALPISQVSHLPVNPAPQQPSHPLDYGVVASSFTAPLFKAHSTSSAPFACLECLGQRNIDSLSNGVNNTYTSDKHNAERIYKLTIGRG